MADDAKPIVWIGSSREDLTTFPEDVKSVMGYALYVAQHGGKHSDAKVLKGYNGAGVLEVVDDYDGETYRAVYTVKYNSAVYVLHAFQKKSRKGVSTDKRDIEIIKKRLREAEERHKKPTTRGTGYVQ